MSVLSLCNSGVWTSSLAYFTLFWCLAGLSSECFLLWAALKRNHNAIEAPSPLNHPLGCEVDFLLLSRPVAISRCLTPCLSNRMLLLLASPRQCIFPAPRERPRLWKSNLISNKLCLRLFYTGWVIDCIRSFAFGFVFANTPYYFTNRWNWGDQASGKKFSGLIDVSFLLALFLPLSAE